MTNVFTADTPLVVRVSPSPNHGERRLGRVDALVLHYTGMPTGAAALAWLCHPESQVSCHYLVGEADEIIQIVPEHRRAWHAGQSFWAGESDLNSLSIGIEIVHPGHDAAGGMTPFPDQQIAAVIALCQDIIRRHGIVPWRVLAHSDIAPARKRDPGEAFPWARLAQAGIGHWMSPTPECAGTDTGTATGEMPLSAAEDESDPAALRALQQNLAAYGYGIAATGAADDQTRQVITAFQRHFRSSCVNGLPDRETRAILTALLERIKQANGRS
jgi:N-acetylmuramoyl-L-alanine amidase